MAHWTGWKLLGLHKEQWAAVHTTTAFLFAIIVTIHFLVNWNPFWNYVVSRSRAGLNRRWEMLIAVLLPAAVVAGTLAMVSPMGNIVSWGDDIKSYWASKVTAPAPHPHAEDLPLERFAETVGLTGSQVADALRAEGYKLDSVRAKFADVAERNAVSPMMLFEAILKHHPEAEASRKQRRGGRKESAGG